MAAIIEDQAQLKHYLLGDLEDAAEEQIERRLLADPAYAEELELVAEEMIDQYVDGELPDAERKILERNFFKSPQRREQLQFAMILRRERLRRTANPKLLRIYLPVAAAVLVSIGAGIGIWRASFYESDSEKGRLALQTAFKNQRPLQARLSGFKYAPTQEQRGGQSTIDYVARDRAAQFILNSSKTDAESYHAKGTYYLAQREFDKAIHQLNAALSGAPQNALIHNDLGVALFEKAKSRAAGEAQNAVYEQYNQSLNHFNKALELNASFLEPLFNRALLYEQMMLPQRAEDDWRLYLEKETNAEWSDEAKQNLARLEDAKKRTSENIEQLYQQFVRDYRAGEDEGAWQAITLSSARIGNLIVERLIDEYLNLLAQGQLSEARDRHQMLRYVGDVKRTRAGDHYIAAMAKAYRSITPAQATAFISARTKMKLGQVQLASGQYSPALASHAEAKRLYKAARDIPEATLNEYWIAICRQQLNEKKESAGLLKELLQICESKKYRWLAVRALNALAYHEATLSQFSKAVRYSHEAHELAEETSEAYGNISALCALMQGYLYLGNRQQSLDHVHQVLSSGNSSIETKQRWTAYNEAAWALSSFGLLAAAADYQKVAVQLAQQIQDPSIESLSYIRLGAIYGRVFNYDEALKNFGIGFKILESHPEKPFAQPMTAYALLQLGSVYRQQGELDKAIASFKSSIDIYTKLKLPVFVYQARKGKLLSHIAANDTVAAREEAKVTVDLYEEYRSTIIEESNRNSFFDFENDVYDVIVDFEYSMPGGSERAFEYAEHSRARSLLALVAATETQPQSVEQPRSVEQLRSLIPEQAQIIQYAVLDHRIVIWVLWRDGFYSNVSKIEAQQLKEKTSAYLLAIQTRDQEQILHWAKELYSILLRPIETVLDKNKYLYIVPDKVLVQLPFVALVSPDSDRYAIEDYSFATSPSANIFLQCTRAARHKVKQAEELLLAVGNPDFDREEFADFPYLRSSGIEVEQIGDFYNRKQLLVWKQALKKTVVQEMTKADVIHLASHAITDERSPLRSKLLLARATMSDKEARAREGVLEASEIYKSSFSQTRLVVLSACQTGTGPSFRGEGVMSMARPFLARGVPMVVASLWAVDSDSTAELMVNFHKYRGLGYTTIAALKKAQLEMLHGSRKLYQQPYYWAAFSLIGGYGEV